MGGIFIYFIIFVLSCIYVRKVFYVMKLIKKLKNKFLIECVFILVLDFINVIYVFGVTVVLFKFRIYMQVLVFYFCWFLFCLGLFFCCVLQIDYFNNQIIVDFVEQQYKGIIVIFDDVCMNVGKVIDEMFFEVFNSKLGKYGYFFSRKVMFDENFF